MSKVQQLRVFVNQRLSAAAEEIFELFERTIFEYEEKLCRFKENQHKLLNAVYNPEVRLHRAEFEQLCTKEEVLPEQKVDPPEPLQVKEEQEGLWTLEQPENKGGADVVEFTLTSVLVKSEEDDGEKPQRLQLRENQTGETGHTQHLRTEQNFNSDSHLDSVTHEEETVNSSDGERSDSDYVGEGTSEPQTRVKPTSDAECNTGIKLINFFPCVTDCVSIKQLQTQVRIRTEDKPFPCSVCGKRYPLEKSLKKHMRRHWKEKHFSCSVCKKSFPWRGELVVHMRIHAREKPFSCSVCGKRFARKNLTRHMRTHTGEKPYKCSLCGKRFAQHATFTCHLKVHTKEKAYFCSICGRGFAHSQTLKRHSRVHTGEKPFSCEICNKRFARLQSVKKHKCVVVEGSKDK